MATYSDRNLIVNYVPQGMEDADLRRMFSGAGEVRACRIIRDKTTGVSYGFGFVEYATADEAALAIDMFNGFRVQNKMLKVAFARMPGQESKNSNIYVQNLPDWVTKTDLEQVFGQFGSIIQARVVRDNNTGLSRRCAFILFELHSAAVDSMGALGGNPWPGTPPAGRANPTERLNVRFADDSSKKVRPPSAGILPFSGLYEYGNGSGGGPMRHQLGPVQRFNPLGLPPSPAPVTHPRFGAPPVPPMPLPLPGPGPIHFPSLMAQPGTTDGFVIYVYNIGNDANECTLYQLFAPFGAIVTVTMPRQPDGKGKNFGFVTFRDYVSAQDAVNAMNSYVYQGKPLQVNFKQPRQLRERGNKRE